MDSSARPTERPEDEATGGAPGKARGLPVFTGRFCWSLFCVALEKDRGPVSVPGRQMWVHSWSFLEQKGPALPAEFQWQ